MRKLVSVICLCFNHQRFVIQAIESVLSQTYPNWELIILDDASTDDSSTRIACFLKEIDSNQYPQRIIFLPLKENVGNCSAFNTGFAESKGDYIIDLAADDHLHPNRIKEQLSALQSAPPETGVCFTNALLIDEEGKDLGNYYSDWYKKKVKQGYIFKELIRADGMVCSPTMMIKREVLKKLEGYDEQLSYEDYDFWVRSSRDWKYIFINKNLTSYRQVLTGHHNTFNQRKNSHLRSTYLVCLKAYLLCQSKEEFRALLISTLYHGKEAAKLQDYKTALRFTLLSMKVGAKSFF